MSMTADQPRLSPAPPDTGIRPRRWTRDEYYRAAELGLFRPGERLELLDGEIIQKMSPQKEPHAVGVASATQILIYAFGSGHHLRVQLPLVLNGRSEPEPDLVVVAGGPSDYLRGHPRAADARLLVEVADTTLRYDRGRKRAAYARAGVQEYWIVNLPERQLEVYRDPSGARYRSLTVYGEQETVTPLAAPQASVRVSDLLPFLSAST
jgi:Uma2 family endonuclease